MIHLSVFKGTSESLFEYKKQYLMVSKKRNPLGMWGWDRKICLLGSPFVITRQASWCQKGIRRTYFPIPPTHSWWILIISHVGRLFRFLLVSSLNRPQGFKTFPCSTQLSTKLILLINVKMPTMVGILTFISMINTTSERLRARNFFI